MKKIIKILGVSVVCCLGSIGLAPAVFAEDCQAVYQPALQQLQQIEAELLGIKNKKTYQESVTVRYGVIENLLVKATECDASTLDAEGKRDIHQVRMALSSLQASAQASAFTKFADWVTAKELDLSLCRRVIALEQLKKEAENESLAEQP